MEKSGESFFALSRKNMERLICAEDRERFLETFHKDKVLAILEREGSLNMRYRLMSGGVPIWVSLKATLLEDEDSRYLIIGTSDIDAQMRRELEYEKSVAEARASARSDFLANMSHDIRTPMNAIVCNLDEVFRRIEDITTLQAQNKSLAITYNYDEVKHSLVNADELRIEQVLVNILSNAIKYTPSGKTVALIIEEEPVGGSWNRYGSSYEIRGLA